MPVIYKCEICSYDTLVKRDYSRHMQTKKHINNEKEYRKTSRKKFSCPNCNCTFVTQSGFTNHSKVCVNTILIQKEMDYTTNIQKLTNNFELETIKKDTCIELLKKDNERLQELIKMKDDNNKELLKIKDDNNKKLLKIKDESNKKIEDILENENEYHKTLVDRAGNIVKTSMSALQFAKTNYPDAPALVKYNNMDAVKLNKEYGVGATMIWHYENHTLAEAIGSIILKEYQKEDPSFQSLWNSDFSRIAYVIMDDVNNKKQWIVDKGGVRVQELLVDPILFHIRGKLIKRSVRKAKELADDFHHPEKYILAMNQCNILIKKIDNKTIGGKVMRYLSKFLHIGNQMKTIEA